jgi:alkanesulfonate monooxygenase SsuD/methylene tetrahydromethanopterin reductase-like flavin-dependent oxidoreductase (luciferase family)
VKLGIGLPNTLAHETDRRLFLSWARTADEAGFHTLGTIDKPNYDSWDPLTSLAAAAGVTERARLATTILQLPNRNETLVAKQAAVIDQVSGGRLDLGVAVGGREDDYEIFEAHFRGKGRRLARQVERIREIWEGARASTPDHGVLGPAPAQEPGPPIWIGGSSPPAIQRAIELGDGFIFGTPGPQRMADMTPKIRERAAARGKSGYTVAGLAYVGVGDDPAKALEQAAHHVLRYYGRLWGDPAEIIHHGPGPAIAEDVAKYAESGIDLLIVFPEIPDLSQVERLAEDVLPQYR